MCIKIKMWMKNKKADFAVTLLVFMAIVLAGAASLIFILSSGSIKAKIVDARFLDEIYMKEGQLDFYLQEIFNNSIKNFKIEDGQDKLVDNFKQELNKYKQNENYFIEEAIQVQVEQELNKEHIKIENGKIIAEFEIKIVERGEPFSASYTYNRKFEKQIKELEKKRLIFIPVNWDLSQQEFNEAIDSQYNYFLSLLDDSRKTEFEKFVYFDNLDYVFGGGQEAVKLVEDKVTKNLPSYDKDRDFVVALTPKMTSEDTLGHVWGQYNIVLVKYDSASTLAHELGHAIWGFCEEYIYLKVSCKDKNFEENFKQEILNNPDAYFILQKKLEYEEIDAGTFYKELSESGKFTNDFLNNIFDCSTSGWLFQNYLNPRKDVLSCPNPYPECCVDNPKYLGDNNEYGVNCNPGISKRGDASTICVGAPCGDSCRSIMGGDAEEVKVTYKYPL